MTDLVNRRFTHVAGKMAFDDNGDILVPILGTFSRGSTDRGYILKVRGNNVSTLFLQAAHHQPELKTEIS